MRYSDLLESNEFQCNNNKRPDHEVAIKDKD